MNNHLKRKLMLACLLVLSTSAFAREISLPQNKACADLNDLVIAPLAASETTKETARMKNDSYIFFGPNAKGEVVQFENHNKSYSGDAPHPLWSATKAMTTTMAARAIELGLLKPEQKLTDIFGTKDLLGARKYALGEFLRANPNKKSDAELEKKFAEITVQDIMEMKTGLDWWEHEEKGLPETSSMNMLYGPGAKNTFMYVLGLPMKFAPGRAWNYSSGNTVILSAILKKVAGPSFPSRLLFNPLQMSSAFIERDPAGLPVGSSFGHMSARDMLKVGKLFLNDGKLDGKQFLPKDWMKKATTASKAYLNSETDAHYVNEEKDVYGLALAVNQSFPSRGIDLPFPEAPKDMFFAAGHFGQLVIVIPSRQTVIVRTGYDSKYWSKVGKIAQLSLACFAGKTK